MGNNHFQNTYISLDFELPYLWSDGRNLVEKVKKKYINNIAI